MRVRFAPSPTGFLHVGGARTALFNFLAARGADGTFIVRSDDTDAERNTPEFYADIVEGLRWLGLSWDEGIEVGGPHGSYKQSDRLDRYREAALDLAERGEAYRCFCTPQELEERRRRALEAGSPPGYDGRCRTIDAAEATARSLEEPFSVRLAIPRPGKTTFADVIRGEVTFDHANVDDYVLLRSNGLPTYHLASTVDDVDYAITHVVRGEDLLSSTPKHILLAAALGQGGGPVYAHLPLIQGPDGRKLSKRHGETSVGAYRAAGYLPAAMVNYLALLGWSGGGDGETVVPLEKMIDAFRLEDVSKNPAVFDTAKLQWLNGVYLRAMPVDDFTALAAASLEAELGRKLEAGERQAVADLSPHVQERVKLTGEISEQMAFLFGDEVAWDEESWDKVMTAEGADRALGAALVRLESIAGWTHDDIEKALRSMLEETDLSARKGLQPIRVAVTGSRVSPPLFESLQALGRGRSLLRMRAALARLQTP